jgi:carboxyl-terminal processing protease
MQLGISNRPCDLSFLSIDTESSMRVVTDLRLLKSALLGALICGPVWAQEVATAPVSAAEVDQLWLAGADHIVSGDFSKARDVLSQIRAAKPDNGNFEQVASWLERLGGLTTEKLEFEIKQRDQYLELAHRAIKKEKWDEALSYARRAHENAPAASEFLREPWVQELHDKAVAQARAHRDAKEWADASGLFFELKSLYEGNTEYEEQMDMCLTHSRLKVLYEDSDDWHRRLNGITASMGEMALERVDQQYVSSAPDFKSVTRAGFERLLLLPSTPVLEEQFDGIKDESKHQDYVNRIERTLKRIERREVLSFRQARDYFKRALTINSQTVALAPEIVIYEYMEAGLAELDRFTSMIWPAEYSDFEKHTQGHFPGVGIQISIENNQLTVVSPLEDTPAYRAGIQKDDRITHIDGDSTEGVTLTEAVRKITGPIKTEVVLTIHRPRTKQTFEVPLQRDEIQIQTVRGFRRHGDAQHWDYIIDPEFKIAYVRLTNFADQTATDLRRALKDIDDQGGKALILDLRFNPGGLLRSAIEVSEQFLPRDLKVVSTEGARSDPQVRFSRSRSPHFTKPVIVLVNEQSASASEIVSGALKDHRRAMIVGERTFGKGSVQNLIPVLRASAYVKLTTAYYYLPEGQLIHKVDGADEWGVEPDVIVELTPRERFKVASMRRDADVIRSGGSEGIVGRDITAEVEARSKEKAEADATKEGDPGSEPKTADGTSKDEGETKSADGTGDTPTETAASDEAEEELPDPIEVPEVDHQLETAMVILRVQLVRDLGFGILPKVRLGDRGAKPAGEPLIVTN